MIDAATLAVLLARLSGVAEEGLAVLRRSASSPNIKERADCSTALFSARGELLAQSESIPVHLGSMPASVRAVITDVGDLAPSEQAVVNDPYAGGTHLNDVTVVAPVYLGEALVGWVANRAHHAGADGQKRVTKLTDRRNKNWTYAYSAPDQNGVITTTETAPVEGTQTSATTYTISSRAAMADGRIAGGNIKSITDQGAKSDPNAATVPVVTNYGWTANRLTAVTDAYNNVTSYEYNDLGLLKKITRPAPNTSSAGETLAPTTSVSTELTYTYPAQFKQTPAQCGTVPTPSGPVTADGWCSTVAQLSRVLMHGADTFQRRMTDFVVDNTTGNLMRITQRANPNPDIPFDTPAAVGDRQTSFTYYGRGSLESVNGPRTDITDGTTYGDGTGDALYGNYDRSGLPTKVTDANQKAQQFTYTPYGMLGKTIDRHGNVTKATFDERDNLRTATDPVGSITRFEYDANNNKTKITKPSQGNRYTLACFDSNDRAYHVATPGASTAPSATCPVETQLPVAQTGSTHVSRILNDDGTVKTQYNERGAATNFEYWPNRKLHFVDAPTPTGRALTHHYYDAAGRERRTVLPLASAEPNAPRPETLLTFNPNGSVAKAERTGWDGSLSSIVDFTYNAFGEPIKSVGPRGDSNGVKQIARTAYNRFGQAHESKRLKSGNPQNQTDVWVTTSSVFDDAGNLISQANPTRNGATLTATYRYDALGRLDKQLNDPAAPGHTVLFGYDFEGRQTSRADQVSNTTVREVSTVYNPDSTVQSQLATTTGVLGASTIATCNYPANTPAGQERSLGYDIDGNLLVTRTLTGGNCATGLLQGQTSNTYGDDRGWLTQSTQTVRAPSGSQLSRTQLFTYEKDGQWKTATHGNQTTTYNSDESGPIESINDWRGKTSTFSYLASGPMSGQTVGGAATASFTWMPNGLAKSLTWTSGIGNLRSHSVTAYDDAFRKTETVSVRKKDSTAYDSGTASYGYDQLDRLTAFTAPFTDPAAGSQLKTTYTLDDGGNTTSAITVKASTQAAWSSTTSSYDPTTSQLTRQVFDAQDPANPATDSTDDYVPDELGQEKTRPGRTTKYDGLGHVLTVDDTTAANNDVAYVYDAADNVLSRTETNGPTDRPTFTAYFSWPGGSPAEEVDAAGNSITQYVPGPGGAPLGHKSFNIVNGVVDTTHTGTAAWLLNDIDGSPGTLVDDNGNVVSQNAWDAYGQPTKAGSTDPTKSGSPLGYGGSLRDNATGALLLGARQYDPKTSRFTTPDYFVAAQLDIALGADELTGNRYLYAAANPVGFYENGYWPSFKSIVNKVKKVAKAVATNKIVRSVAIGIAVGVAVTAACGTGIGCVVAAGAIAGGLDALTNCKKKAGVKSCAKQVAIGSAVGAVTSAVTFGAGKYAKGRFGAASKGQPASTLDDTAAAAARGGESEAAKAGRAMHDEFDQQLRNLSELDPSFQPGLKSGPHRPDGFFDGNPIELKPNTPSGLSAGRSQLRRYMEAFGADRGYLATYDENGAFRIAEVIEN